MKKRNCLSEVLILTLSICCACPLTALAQEEAGGANRSNTNLEVEVVMPIDNTPETYDFNNTEELAKILWELNYYQKDNHGKWRLEGVDSDYIPVGSPNPKDVEALLNLTSDQQTKFLSRKHKFISGVQKIFKFVRMKSERIQTALIALNERVYQSMAVVTNADSKGVNIGLSFSLGLSLSHLIGEKLKLSRLLKYLPESGGFYYVFSMGFSLMKKDKNLYLTPYFDYEHLMKTTTFTSEISGAVHWGVVHEISDESPAQSLDANYSGIFGVIRQGPNHFSYNLITGLAVPPYFPLFMVYTNAQKRYRLGSLNISPVINLFKKRASSCREIL